MPGALPGDREKWDEWQREHSEDAEALTDAEQRMAADGAFFRTQLNAAREEEEREAARVLAEETAAEERRCAHA